jgi:hypothetical protein
MDFADGFTWLVLSLDVIALSVGIGWYLAENCRRRVPYRRSLSSDPRIFDPHVLVNGRWIPQRVTHWARLPPSEQRAWFGLHR